MEYTKNQQNRGSDFKLLEKTNVEIDNNKIWKQ